MSYRENKAQKMALETLLKNIEQKYLNRDNMYDRILHSRSKSDTGMVDIIGRLDMIDSVRENVRTALQFGNYKRATWYLSFLLCLCEKYFK